ncbi:MAG TPA: lipocalin-like domain-containing protein [Thermoanaerobaculia bacterium]|nr:lipocalin-like domain-containing protein [Thermoanaerobaculia bacterium]
MRYFWAILLLACAAGAQVAPSGFRHAVPGWRFAFPRDHGAHPEFQTEWWYYTGHLLSAEGRRYGFELTFFRVGVHAERRGANPWDLRDLALTHFAISDIDGRKFRYHEKVNRMSRYTAGAGEGDLNLFNEGWSAVALPDGRWRIRASEKGDSIDLVLRAVKPPAIHGTDGVSVKGAAEGAASHYYSMTRLEAEGSIRAGGTEERCRGQAWMDHEFSTSVLGEEQKGWDWFSLQFDDGTELMLYQMRHRDGSIDPASSGSWVDARGGVEMLRAGEYAIEPVGTWRSPKSGGVYPMGWRLSIPRMGLRIDVREEMKDQELVTSSSTGVTYWEGAVTARGTARGKPVRAKGYVEMTGYAAPFKLP